MTPNPFDQASRYLVKQDPVGHVGWVLDPAGTIGFHDWLDTRTLPFPGTPDRTLDTVAALYDPTAAEPWWAVPWEFSTSPDPSMFGRLLEYLGRLWRERRPPGVPEGRYNVGAVVVNLTGVGRTSRSMQLGGGKLQTTLLVVEVNLEQQSAAATLAGIVAGSLSRSILAWIPLMQGGSESGIIDQWKRLAEEEPDERRRADYAGLALVFADLTQSRSVWKPALEGWNVQVSQQVLEWQAEAEKRGRKKSQREALLRALQLRFGKRLPAGLKKAIQACEDLVQLEQWFDYAVTAASLDEFRRATQL